MVSNVQSDEHLLYRVHQHWIKYVIPVFLYVVLSGISILLFLLAGYAAHHVFALSYMSFVGALLLFLFAHHWFFIMLICESTTYILITNKRVIWLRDRLFVEEDMHEFSFEKMKTVSAVKRGVLQTILRYGKIRFENGPDIVLVPHPNRVAKEIEQAMGLS